MMKMKDKYQSMRDSFVNFIILMKCGSFYITFDEDAKVLNYLFDYKINNDKLGFPLGSLEKVLFTLKEKKISYILYQDEEELAYESLENHYEEYLSLAEKFAFHKASNDLLMERIRILLEKKGNYEKIKEFIDEL